MNIVKKPVVFIFDLDGTICKDTLNSRQKLNYVLNMIREAHHNNGHIYVVTARRLSDFNNDEQKLFTFNVPKEITDLINMLNRYKTTRWLYYNNNDDHANQITISHLARHGKIRVYDQYMTLFNFLRWELLNLGYQKMVQIDEILSRHSSDHLIYFFDDASHNKHAWGFYFTHINPRLSDVNFIGGEDKKVF